MVSNKNGTSLIDHRCVVGVQWGDEGKGKIVDLLSADFDAVVRYQGGANAGHTVLIGEDEFVFHLVPSGILQEGKACIIGNGAVLDLASLIDEMDGLLDRGIEHEEQIYISDRAHIVMPYHKTQDRLKEAASGKGKIGTTLRGIGPCYTDKAARKGIRTADLKDWDRFTSLVEANVESINKELAQIEGETPLDAKEIIQQYKAYRDRLLPRITNIADLLWTYHGEGKRILFEGAQGALLDLDHGTYPFVTSSSTSFLGLGPGTGFSPRQVKTVLGITKAYTTRVGGGPFPTELDNPLGEELRRAGGEFGATTGRPRRCGWIDLFALRYTIRFSDIDAMVITKLDVLDEMDSLQVCVGYEGVGTIEDHGNCFPTDLEGPIQPIYRDVPGWKGQKTTEARSLEELPQQAIDYLQYIADAVQCPIAIVSVGKERTQIIDLDPWLMPRNQVEAGRG